VTSNEPAEVLIDGVRAGETPYQGKVGLGSHTVTVKTAGAERELTVEATSKPVQLEMDFSKP
jgi:PEGA domain